MKLLFVCTANMQRSPTAEHLFDSSEKHEAKSAGIHPLAGKPLTVSAINWADVIFCMEEYHKNFILDHFPESQNKELIVLDIPDIYEKNSSELIRLLDKKLKTIMRKKS